MTGGDFYPGIMWPGSLARADGLRSAGSSQRERGNRAGGTARTLWNSCPGPACCLLVLDPRTFVLIQAIHATDDRSPVRTRQLYAACGATLVA